MEVSVKVVIPIGLLILFASGAISSNYSEDIKEGLEVVPIFLHWPLQIIIPGVLLLIAFFRKLGKQPQTAKDL